MIGFRLDANKYIATGHMMRCIVIARQCIKRGEQCVFLVADEENVDILKKYNMKYIVMHTKWDKWDESISTVEMYVKELNISLLVVDSYCVTEKFMSDINKIVPVFYIDDMCNKAYDISMVLHISEWDGEYTLQQLYKDKKNIKLLMGMKYMPLREEFTDCPNIQERKQIMITTGGTDPFHITLKVVQCILKENDFTEYDVVAVLGKMNEDRQKLLYIANNNPCLKIMHNISNIGEIMKQSCVAVSAGGGTVYELCMCDTPMVCVAFSDDQTGFGKRMHEHQILSYAGDIREKEDIVLDNIIKYLKEILDDKEKNKLYRDNMKKMVDGKGAARIAQCLIDYLNRK